MKLLEIYIYKGTHLETTEVREIKTMEQMKEILQDLNKELSQLTNPKAFAKEYLNLKPKEVKKERNKYIQRLHLTFKNYTITVKLTTSPELLKEHLLKLYPEIRRKYPDFIIHKGFYAEIVEPESTTLILHLILQTC